MARSSNILEELMALESGLAKMSSQNPYSIPEGYFEGLAATVLARIKALEANSPVEEISYLSPYLAGLSKSLPYTLPTNFFESLESRLEPVMRVEYVPDDVEAELKSISPFLGGLKKRMPYSIPGGYFENLVPKTEEAVPMRAVTGAKVVPIARRSWLRVAVAALVIGFVATAGLIYFNRINSSSTKSFAKFEKTVDKEIKKASDKELNEFVEQFTLAGLNGTEKALADNKTDSRISLKDVSDAELKQFLDDTSDADADDLSAPNKLN